MKRLLLAFGLLLVCITAKSQSMQFMGTWKGPKFVSDYFWSNGNINVFSTNEVTYFNSELALMTRDYAEFKLGNTDLYVHPEFQVFFKITESVQLGVDFLYDDYNKFLVLGALRIAL